MDKILINNQEVNIISANSISNGLEIKTNTLTLAEAEVLFPTNVAVNLEIANESGEIYGKYANLKAYCIAKITEGEEEIIEIKLGIVNEITQKINTLEQQLLDTQYALAELYEGMVL
jgi:hypothetical protein